MEPPENERAVLVAQDGDAVVKRGLAVRRDYPNQPKNAIATAVRCTRFAGHLLREAMYSLDDAGYSCEALDDLTADTLALSATWAGRPVPNIAAPVPKYVVEAAQEWHRTKRRGC